MALFYFTTLKEKKGETMEEEDNSPAPPVGKWLHP